MEVDPRIAGWLLVLFGCSGLYACWLHSLDARYNPNWTWVTVVGGNALIGLTLFGIEWFGVTLTGWLNFSANVAAGAPIIIWQVAQWLIRRTRNGHG